MRSRVSVLAPARPVALLLLWLGGIGLFGTYAGTLLHHVTASAADPELSRVFFSIASICVLGFVSFYLSEGLPLPSFVVALLLGIAAKPLLAPIVASQAALGTIVSLGATLILFQGGLETSFKDFRKLFPKIALLAFPGVLLTAVLLSFGVAGIAHLFSSPVSITVAVLLGAVLASTDPAAIIPLLQGLRFKQSATKNIVISESAMNDVVGALLTLTLMGMALSAGSFSSIAQGYAALFSVASGIVLLTQIGFGLAAGIAGYILLNLLSHHKKSHGFEYAADAAFFFVVPIIAFAAALQFGGSGYLAAFIAGLVFNLSEHLKGTEEFYGQVIDGFAKPAIFLLLGALVSLPALLHYAPVGIAAAALFMFVIRPVVVFTMLSPFLLWGKSRLSVQQLLFISAVRETGAIPAVLLVTLVGLGLTNIDALLPIGMWIILATLIVQPPLTPKLAQYLGVAEAK